MRSARQLPGGHALSRLANVPTYARPSVYQDEPERELQRFLDPWLSSGDVRRVLDVGCGFFLSVDFPRTIHLVGLDPSPEALAKNQNVDEALIGDVETYELPAESFDGVLCWTVLEHLSNPRAALANMARSLKPGGLLIVGVPNLWSLKGLVTKLTPHWFHVWVYRHIFRYAEAGAPGHGPYRTYLRRDIAPGRLTKVASELGLERTYSSTWRPTLGLSSGWFRRVWSGVNAVGRIAAFGAWDPEASEYAVVFKKVR